MSEQNKAAVRRAYSAMNNGDFALLSAIIADDFVEHETLLGQSPTKEGTLQMFRAMRDAFPDLRFDVQDMIAEGDRVFVRATINGTQQGEFMGIPATRKQISVPIGDFLRFRGDRVVEHWGVTDSGAMLQQLGVVEAQAVQAFGSNIAR